VWDRARGDVIVASDGSVGVPAVHSSSTRLRKGAAHRHQKRRVKTSWSVSTDSVAGTRLAPFHVTSAR